MLLKKIHKLRYSPLLLLLSCVELPEGKKPAPQNKGIYPLNISLFELPEGADKIKQVNNNTLYFHGGVYDTDGNMVSNHTALPLSLTQSEGKTFYTFPSDLRAEFEVKGVFSKSATKPQGCLDTTIKNGAPKTFVKIPLCETDSDPFHTVKGAIEFPLIMNWLCGDEKIELQFNRNEVTIDKTATPGFWVSAKIADGGIQVLDGEKEIGSELSDGYVISSKTSDDKWVLKKLDYRKNYLRRGSLSHITMTKNADTACRLEKYTWTASDFEKLKKLEINMNYEVDSKKKEFVLPITSYRFHTFIYNQQPISAVNVTIPKISLATLNSMDSCKGLKLGSSFQILTFCRE